MVTNVIRQNAKTLMMQPADSRSYELTHDPEIDELVAIMKQYFRDRVFTRASKGIDVKKIMEGLFNFFCSNPDLGEKRSPFGRAIRLTGFQPRQLAGHLLASLTDEEARQAFKKIL